MGKIANELAQVAYTGNEQLWYDVSWLGGIKIGEISMQQKHHTDCPDCYELDVFISSSGGIIEWLYPVRDRHSTLVRGDERLPYFSESWQQEGRSYKAHKIFRFDQHNFALFKTKDNEDEEKFHVDGVVHNEFSSFFSTRVMPLGVGKPIIVPTFGNDRRHEVVVNTLAIETVESELFGPVETLKVSPVLTFSGIYKRKGDTVIWFTDDECRVPVMVKSKIAIGSLYAELTGFRNDACSRYGNYQKNTKE